MYEMYIKCDLKKTSRVHIRVWTKTTLSFTCQDLGTTFVVFLARGMWSCLCGVVSLEVGAVFCYNPFPVPFISFLTTLTWKPKKTTSFRGAMDRHGQAGSWRGQWTGWIGSAPVQISGCGLDGALSWYRQGEGQSSLVSSWAARAVAAAPSFQTYFACVHM